jgi:polyisoprenoid-binding protein YceI
MSTITTAIDGVERPAPGTWRVDPGHAEIAFIGRHFGLTKVRGRFTRVDGTVTLADDIAASDVEVTIDMASVTSGYDDRDDHLRSPDLFDVTNHPTATFRSTSVVARGAGGNLTGDLTLKGVTRPVTLAVEYLGSVADPWGNHRAIFSASTTINREDWGLTWNALLDTGGLLVSKEIRIEVEVELVRQPS